MLQARSFHLKIPASCNATDDESIVRQVEEYTKYVAMYLTALQKVED